MPYEEGEANDRAPRARSPGEMVLPPPPVPTNGYLRAAVIQLAFHPSATVEQFHLLEQPAITSKTTNWFDTGLGNELRRVRACQKNIARKIRSIYAEHEIKRVGEIVRTCSHWGVQLLVFPEYSIPPECLVELLPLTKGMTVVFGTHSVEAHFVDEGFYDQFGTAIPTCGTSVAPVAIDGVLKCFQPKLNSTHLEIGMICGHSWDAIELPSSPRMGVLICLDFLKRETAAYRTHVGAKIDDCKIIAVPSLTPDYTIERFEARAIDESKGYARSALYADIADGGGSSIFVASALDRPSGTFPFGIPSLSAGEEGLVIADLDVEYTCTSEKISRTYSDRKAVIPVAWSRFRYRAVQPDVDYIDRFNSFFANCDLTSRASIAGVLRQRAEEIAKLADASGPTVAARINDLLESYSQARTAEELLCRLRDVVFSEDVFPLPVLDMLRARAARDEADAFMPVRAEEEEIGRLRRRLHELCGEAA